MFYTAWTLGWLETFYSKSLPMQEFRNCRTTSRQQSVPAVLQAALMLLPFRSTDPKQRVNPQSRLPRLQMSRASALRRPRIPLVRPILDG